MPNLPGDSSWWTVDGGGYYLSAGPYTLGATVGQADAGTVSDGAYTLQGGYWPGATVARTEIYVPVTAGYLQMDATLTFGDAFKGLAFCVLAVAFIVRGSLRRWSGI
jgi:hypothetical protein